jgi:hypothetical protein
MLLVCTLRLLVFLRIGGDGGAGQGGDEDERTEKCFHRGNKLSFVTEIAPQHLCCF